MAQKSTSRLTARYLANIQEKQSNSSPAPAPKDIRPHSNPSVAIPPKRVSSVESLIDDQGSPSQNSSLSPRGAPSTPLTAPLKPAYPSPINNTIPLKYSLEASTEALHGAPSQPIAEFFKPSSPPIISPPESSTKGEPEAEFDFTTDVLSTSPNAGYLSSNDSTGPITSPLVDPAPPIPTDARPIHTESFAKPEDKAAVAPNTTNRMANNSGVPRKVIMIGNPGVGKSTLLSSLVCGHGTFQSGVAIGKGKTTELQEVEYNGTIYVDTPGLSDVKLREQAAGEIANALKLGGKFKIFFVLTLESGRVKPDDLTTIKLVLTAAEKSIGNNEYSILVNKMTPEVIEALKVPEERNELVTTLVPPSLKTKTDSIFFIPINLKLTDQNNMWEELSPDLLNFIKNAPEITIDAGSVQDIQFANFEKILAGLREEIRLLREDNARLRQEMLERDKQLRNPRNIPYATSTPASQPAPSTELNASYAARPSSPPISQVSDTVRNIPPFGGSIILCGNSGVGKSTLLTCLVNGSVQFPSGISFGQGLTKKLQQVSYKGTNYVDTPGLADPQHREQAATEIESALKQGGKFKIFFVVTLESGRVKPDDLATMKLVLTAADKFQDDKYSVIINKMTEEVRDTLRDPNEKEKLTAAFQSIGINYDKIFFVPLNSEWDDKQNKWSRLSQELCDFVNSARPTKISTKKVKSIKTELYDETVSALNGEIQKLQYENIKLQKKFKRKGGSFSADK